MLAQDLGGKTVEEWQNIMSSKEFAEWCVYYKHCPPESRRADYRAALVSSTIANAMSSGKGRKPKLKDFIFKFEKPKRVKGDDLKTKLMAWASQHNARFKKKGK